MKFLKRYNELWLGPIGLILFIISQPVIKAVDPEAVVYTSDAVQKIIFGHIVFASCIFSTWIALRLTWPSVFRFLVDEFNESLTNLTTWEKLKLSFLVFACYLLGLILCMQVL